MILALCAAKAQGNIIPTIQFTGVITEQELNGGQEFADLIPVGTTFFGMIGNDPGYDGNFARVVFDNGISGIASGGPVYFSPEFDLHRWGNGWYAEFAFYPGFGFSDGSFLFDFHNGVNFFNAHAFSTQQYEWGNYNGHLTSFSVSGVPEGGSTIALLSVCVLTLALLRRISIMQKCADTMQPQQQIVRRKAT